MADLALSATTRTATGRHVRALRRSGSVPAVVYGHQTPPITIETEERVLRRIWQSAGRTHLIALTLDGAAPRQVLFRELQMDPRTARPLHADFFVVNLRQKLAADVPVVITGDAPAVTTQKVGQLLQILTSVRVECLPTELPAQLHADVSGLEEVDAAVTVGDLELPPGVTVLTDAAELVVKIAPLRVQEVEAAPEAPEGEAAEAPAVATPVGEQSAEG